MNKSAKVFFLSLMALLVAATSVWAQNRPQQRQPQAKQHAEGKENVLVGRISLVEGELLRYVPAEKDWVVAVKDSPFGFEDALYSGEGGRAEFLMPNSTWLRIGPNTQIQMIVLKADVTEVDVAVGTVRFVDKSSKAIIKATTPFGYVVADPGSAFDLYVGDESVEVIGIRGSVEFIHDADGSRYEVVPGSMSILADARQATASEGKVDADWDDWNVTRDTMWSQSIETKGESAQYLPEGIREDAGTLDETGRWERVYYEGEYRQVWRPTAVEPDWAPYTVGRWTDWYGDYTWVPEERFGYVTHHYGYWFWANDYWYWAPPIVRVGVGVPWWGIGFSWYPGRVGWLYSDVHFGWFPLLPWEPFYAHHWWGPRSFVVNNIALININIGSYRHHHRAFFVDQRHLFTTNNLRTVRATSIDRTTITRNFRGTPVASNTVLRNANTGRRFNFTNATPTARPTNAALSRVSQNQARIASGGANVSGRAIRQQLSSTRVGKPVAGAGITAPRATSRLSSGMGAAGASGAGQPRALKQNTRTIQSGSARITTTPGTGGGGGTAVQSGRRGGKTISGAGSSQIGRGQASVKSQTGTAVGKGGGGGGGGITTRGQTGVQSKSVQPRTGTLTSPRSQLGGQTTRRVPQQQFKRSDGQLRGGSSGQFRKTPSVESRGLQSAPKIQGGFKGGPQGAPRAPALKGGGGGGESFKGGHQGGGRGNK